MIELVVHVDANGTFFHADGRKQEVREQLIAVNPLRF